MNNSRIKLLKNIHFRGDLKGKYEAKIISNANNDSKISLIETTISETEVCSELDVFNHNYNNLEYAKVEDVTINLANNKDLKDYRFVEDITNLKIGDVSLSKQMKDGSITFGVIQGRAMFTLKKEDEVLINFYRKPKEDLEIIFPDIEKKRRKEGLLKLLKSISFLFLAICLVFFLVFIISNIDFDVKKKQFYEFKDKVETKLTSKTIKLTNSGGQNYALLTIDGIKQKFLLDTGASMSTVPSDFIDQLIKKGYITPEIHFIKHEQFMIADGNIIKGGIWRIPKIKIGSETIYNVEFSSVSSKNAPFLLGMSTLERLGNYSIVPNENKIIINK
jgi:aspartyl protease family protein